MPSVGFRSRQREGTPGAGLATGGDGAAPRMAPRVTPQWVKYALVALCIAAIAGAAVAVGPGGPPAARARVVAAERGVVQATVSGTGTVQGANQESVNFKTGGQLQDVFVKVGQHVGAGQVLAQIDATQASLAVDQAQANLSSAEARLAQAEAPGGSSASSGAGGGGTNTSASATTPAAFVQTAAARPQRSGTKRPSSGSRTSGGQSGSRTSTSAAPSPSTGGSPGGGSSTSQSPQATAAAIASAQAGVDSAQAALASAQQTLNDTKLVAPVAGTVASISAQTGESVGGGGSSALQAGASGSSAASSGTGGQGGAGQGGAGGAGGASSSSSGSSSGGSSAFIVLVDTSAFQLQVPISESDVSKLHVGQPATVTVNALPGQQIAAHVTSIDSLPTTNSGVVSYNVDFSLDQSDPGLRPGMTASAQVVVSQVSGVVSVPTAAISRRGGTQTVTLVRGGKTVTQPIVTGIAGDSTTQVISGVNPGDRLEIPIVAAAGGAAAGRGGGLGGGGLGGAGGFGSGGGGGAGRLGGGAGRFGGGG